MGRLHQVKLQRHSEETPASGGFYGGGVGKLLGAAPMDPLTLLVREAVQNSWDARKGTEPVQFRLDFRTGGGPTLDHLRNTVFADHAPTDSHAVGRELNETHHHLFVTDWNTVGLNGPTSASSSAGVKESNFKNFVRNVGATKDGSASGGSYGFGKGSYYLASEFNAVVIFSRCAVGRRTESRLIAAAIGNAVEEPTPLTGRHFWGGKKTRSHVEPIIGADAEDLASKLGFPLAPGEQGTSVMIVGVRTGQFESEVARSLIDAAGHAREQLIWNCWPKMVPTATGEPEMKFTVSTDTNEEAIELDGLDSPALDAFVRSYRDARQKREADQVHCKNPKRLLGSLAMQSQNPATMSDRGVGDEKKNGTEVPTHHVALMRSPGIVVRYFPGPETALWAGTFVVDEDVEDAFRRSETPAHDRWERNNVEKPASTFVNVAHRRIAERAEERWQATTKDSATVTGGSYARVAASLGSAFGMDGLGSASEPERGSSSGGGAASRVRINLHDPDRFDRKGDDVLVMVSTVELSGVPQAANIDVAVTAAVDDGRRDNGSETADLFHASWTAADDIVLNDFPARAADIGPTFRLRLEGPADLAPHVEVRIQEGGTQ